MAKGIIFCWWSQKLLRVWNPEGGLINWSCAERGRDFFQEPAFVDSQEQEISLGKYEALTLGVLQDHQRWEEEQGEDSEGIFIGVDIAKDYGISRSFKTGAITRAQEAGVSQPDVEFMGQLENGRTSRRTKARSVDMWALYGACPDAGRQVAVLEGSLNPLWDDRSKYCRGGCWTGEWDWRNWCWGLEVRGGERTPWLDKALAKTFLWVFKEF
jgi:hypothetical protein